MCVRKASRAWNRDTVNQRTDAAVDTLIRQLRALPLADRSSCALGVASRLIEFAAFELAGRQSADDVANLIDCAARMDFASSDVQVTASRDITRVPQRRLQ